MTHRWRGVSLMLLVGILMLAAVQPVKAAPRIRAAQVSYLPSRNYPEVAAEFARMRRMGFDTVIFRVFQRPGDRYYPFVQPQRGSGVYFSTDAAPVVADVLGSVTTLAHAAGLKVFAWMTTLSTPLVEGDAWCGRRYDPASGRIVPCAALDPFRPEVRQRLATLFKDLARYDIDGVLLQDDLVLRQTEGFSSAALGVCLRDTGRMLSPAQLFPETRKDADGKVRVSRLGEPFYDWARWKNHSLLRLADELRAAARQVRPGLPFALNLPYEVLTSPRNGLAWFSQEFSPALGADFDYLAIMAYHRQMAAEQSVPVEEAIAQIGTLAVSGVRGIPNPAGLLLKLQTRDFVSSRDVTADELRHLIYSAERAGPVSLAFFPYRDSLENITEKVVPNRIEEE